MKIMIVGSMSFAREIIEIKKKLEKLGHTVNIPHDIETHIKDPSFGNNLDEDYKHCVENQVMGKCFELLAESDGILVLNYPKNNIKGYIGTSTLMEIGIAYYLKKKIFILNELPDFNKVRWAHEVKILQPIILYGDLEKVKPNFDEDEIGPSHQEGR